MEEGGESKTSRSDPPTERVFDSPLPQAISPLTLSEIHSGELKLSTSVKNLVDVSDIYFFVWSGMGDGGSPRRQEGGGGGFLLKIPGGGGGGFPGE